MNSFSRGVDRLRRILGIDVEEEVESELEFHLQMRVRDMEAAGMTPEAAREKAEHEFGDYRAIERECRTIAKRRNRTMRRREWLGELRQDVRFGVRQFLRNPGFSLLAVLTLALGIGASTAIFSVVNGVLLRPLPYPEPDHLVAVFHVSDDGSEGNFSHPNFVDVKERSRSFTALAEHNSGFVPVTVGTQGVRVPLSQVSEEFFAALGTRPTLGRVFSPDEFGGDGSVAVVSDAFWRQHLGASPELADQRVRISDRPLTIIGVMPPEVNFPAQVGLWLPQGGMTGTHRTGHNWQVVGRLRPGISPEEASRELNGIARELKREYGDDTNMASAVATPLHEVIVGDVRPALYVLLGASGLLLLIACANVVNLLLTRMAARRRELAVRLALGVGRGRLMRQFVSESLVLTLVGASFGVLIAFAGVPWLLALEPGRLPRAGEVGVDVAALLFALGVSLLAAMAMGVIVVLRASDADIRETLAEGSRGQAGGAASSRFRSVVAAGQVALTLVLLIGAALLGRSFLRLNAVDPGFRTEGGVVMDVLIPWPRSEEETPRNLRFHHELVTRLASIPGVAAAGSVNLLPLGDGGVGSSGTFLKIYGSEVIEGFEDYRRLSREPGRAADAVYRVASSGYFPAMGIPVLRGRVFDERDTSGSTHAAVISKTLAEAAWPDQDPLGQLIQFGGMDGDMTPFVIVGVVGDVREQGLETDPPPIFYANSRQRPAGASGPHNIVMYGGDPRAITSAARAILREMNPEIPARFRTLEQVFSTSLADRRFSLLLLGAFAIVALLLAVTGIYGIISNLVAQRTREIGIRLALGARAENVLMMMVRSGVLMALVGVAAGLLIALASTRLLSGMLFGISTTDALTFVAVPVLLLGVAAVASYVPARRTMRVDPMIAMRAE